MNTEQNRVFLLDKEKIQTALLKLGIPTMIGMLVSAFYNIVDAFFVGRLGTVPTVAVSIIYPLTMAGTGMGLLLAMVQAQTFQDCWGKKEYGKVKYYSSTAIISGLLAVLFRSMAKCNKICRHDKTFCDSHKYGLHRKWGPTYPISASNERKHPAI